MFILLKSKIAKLALVSLLLTPFTVWASISAPQEIQDKLFAAERTYGLPHGFLVAIASHESRFSNSAMNVDGVSFWFDSEREGLNVLYKITKNPYYISAKRPNGQSFKYFADSKEKAQLKVAEYTSAGFTVIKQRNNKLFRKLNTSSTDVCILQINNRAHVREKFQSINEIMDIDTCIDYGAQYLKLMIDKHGLKNGVGCYHNCYIGKTHHTNYVSNFSREYVSLFNKSPF